ncbi:frataxin, mitochondrial, partial [Hevea brasiliensis]|uniref:frataxin, mitochondrial n=1 Tax=Hevea brasiliensis TaxID=3981 RepID=UPI0025EC3BED
LSISYFLFFKISPLLLLCFYEFQELSINIPALSESSLLICFFCSHPLDLDADSQGPATIDYRSLLQEDEFHKLADSTIHDLQEKFEEYGDSIQIDVLDIDYGNEVLTLKLGDLGTYWLSSPVSGPSRFSWDQNTKAWVYRRTKANLLTIFESELEQLCGESIKLSCSKFS